MIRLTRLNHEAVVVNAHVIAFVESTPDTLITLTNGDRVHVRENLDEVVELVVKYHRRIQSGEIGNPAPEAE